MLDKLGSFTPLSLPYITKWLNGHKTLMATKIYQYNSAICNRKLKSMTITPTILTTKTLLPKQCVQHFGLHNFTESGKEMKPSIKAETSCIQTV